MRANVKNRIAAENKPHVTMLGYNIRSRAHAEVKKLVDEAEASALAEQEKTFAERKSRAKKKAERCKKLLERGLAGQKMETVFVSVSYRKSVAVEITDLDALPFIFTTTDIKPNKVKIQAAIDSGELVPGAQIVTRNNIQIK